MERYPVLGKIKIGGNMNTLCQFNGQLLITFVSLCSVISPVIAQESGVDEPWVTMGKTNNGDILSLNVNSIQTKPHAGNWLWFSYRITTSVETREHIGFTGACNRGRLASKLVWQVELVNENGVIDRVLEIKADSPGSLSLLKTVCSRGYR